HLRTRELDDEETTVVLGLHSLSALTRAAGEDALRDWSLDPVISGSAHALDPTEPRPAAATPTGPTLIIPLEYPSVAVRLIDTAADTNASEIVAELLRPATDSTVALRGGRRWRRTYEPLTPVGLEEAAQVLRDGGVYLITG